MTWYTSPEAVAILDDIRRRPRIRHGKTADWCSVYTGRAVEALGQMWLASGEVGSDWHVLGALFGDPNGVGSVWDRSEEWDAIRTRLAGTGGRTALRAARWFKETHHD